MAALPPLEKIYEIARLSPAGKYLEAATAPICNHVICHIGTVQYRNEKTKISYLIK